MDDVLVHPKFKPSNVNYDIAIVYLKNTLEISSRIKTIKITEKEYPKGTEAIVSGWGRTEKGTFSKVLRYAKVKLLSKSECYEQNELFMDDTQICTAAEKRGPCRVSFSRLYFIFDFLTTSKYFGNSCSSGE